MGAYIDHIGRVIDSAVATFWQYINNTRGWLGLKDCAQIHVARAPRLRICSPAYRPTQLLTRSHAHGVRWMGRVHDAGFLTFTVWRYIFGRNRDRGAGKQERRCRGAGIG